MKMKKILFTTIALVLATGAFASEKQGESSAESSKSAKKSEVVGKVKNELKNHFKFYGFIRNYFTYDSHESKAGTGDLFYWTPTDRRLDAKGNDLDQLNQFRYLALTTRLGVDVSGYKISGLEFGAKVETDFYAGLTGSTGTAQLRLRQAYLTMKKEGLGKKGDQTSLLKAGQAWHPMAADLPDIYSLETGAPFGPFSRTPLLQEDYSFGGGWTATAALIWQMQYTSQGPAGASADYMKYGCTPEAYLGMSYAKNGFVGRLGVDILSIKPRNFENAEKTVKALARETSVLGFAYAQYSKGLFTAKAKTVFGQGGEHFGLMSGYVDYKDAKKKWAYDPLLVSSSWVTLAYGQKYRGCLLLGYSENFGTAKSHAEWNDVYFNKNGFANINRLWRIEPEFTYNLGNFTVGIEYMLSGTQFGSYLPTADDNAEKVLQKAEHALAAGGLHWVLNHRVQGMLRFKW